MPKLNYFVGEYTVDHPRPRRVKSLFSVRPGDNETVYHGGGPTHTQRAWLTDLVVLKDYSHIQDSEEVWAQFSKDFPPEPCDIYDPCWPAKDFDGWLSPEGVFYRSEWMGHSSLAIDLAASFFADQTDMYDNDAETVIRRAGWMAISHGGASIQRDVRATDAQRNFLRKLIALNKDFPGYVEGIQRYLNTEERFALTDGKPKCIICGFQIVGSRQTMCSQCGYPIKSKQFQSAWRKGYNAEPDTKNPYEDKRGGQYNHIVTFSRAFRKVWADGHYWRSVKKDVTEKV